MATKIFCDICNTVLATTPSRSIKAVSILPEADPYGQVNPKQAKTTEVTVQVGLDLCDACKGRVLSRLVTADAYAESKIHRFGATK